MVQYASTTGKAPGTCLENEKQIPRARGVIAALSARVLLHFDEGSLFLDDACDFEPVPRHALEASQIGVAVPLHLGAVRLHQRKELGLLPLLPVADRDAVARLEQ